MPVSNGGYARKLAEFKAQETPEVVLLIADSPELISVTVAWTNTAAAPRATLSPPPESDAPSAWWDWLWENTLFSRSEVIEKADISDYNFNRRFRVLVGNRVLYPDGTVNSFVQRYLRSKVLELFSAKSAPKNAKK